MKVRYLNKTFAKPTLAVIEQANAILAEYAGQGFDLTLRQLYYQFVARGLIPNTEREYKRIGSIINDARLAGLIDWNYISDRTRSLRRLAHWADPAAIIQASARDFRVDLWKTQTYRPEVWIEKDALVGVIEGVCEEFDVPYFSCRGYTSQSEMWAAAQRLARYRKGGQVPIVFHLGDHDPSGIDMTRDITDRLRLFMGQIHVNRLGLSMEQVEEYGPPPNPAKVTDSRFNGYMAEYGSESWELDALTPQVIAELVRDAIDELRDESAWDDAEQEQESGQDLLQRTSRRWGEVVTMLNHSVSDN